MSDVKAFLIYIICPGHVRHVWVTEKSNPELKKGRGSVLSEVLQLVQVSHMSLLLQSGVLCSNTTGSLFHSIWVSQGGQGGTSNHHESLASHPNPCIPVVPVYACVCH